MRPLIAAPAPATKLAESLPAREPLCINAPTDDRELEAERLSRRLTASSGANRAITPAAVQPTMPSGPGVALPASVHATLSRPGQPLEPAIREYFEPRFGHDFSRIRIHTGSTAAASAEAIDAFAYTAGSHIVFGHNGYRPTTTPGRCMIAHELVHTLQQARPGAPVQMQKIAKNPLGVPFVAHTKLFRTPLLKSPAKNGVVLAHLDAWQEVTVKGGGVFIEVETLLKGLKVNGYIHHGFLERPDQLTGTEVPDVDEQKKIGAELDPGAFAPAPKPKERKKGNKKKPPKAPPPTRVIWDGRSGQANHLANRGAAQEAAEGTGGFSYCPETACCRGERSRADCDAQGRQGCACRQGRRRTGYCRRRKRRA